MKKSYLKLAILLFIFVFIFICVIVYINVSSKKPRESINIIKYENQSQIEQIIKEYEYDISLDINKKYLYLILINEGSIEFKKFLFSKNETVDINVPNESNFILSLRAERMIPYEWEISYNSNYLELSEKKWIHVGNLKSNKDKEGMSSERQFFYFTALNKGQSIITLKYDHLTLTVDDYFKMKVRIKVE